MANEGQRSRVWVRRLIVALGLAVLACGGGQKTDGAIPSGGEATPPPATPDLLALEQAAYEKARPVFEKHCAKCHTTAGKKAKKQALEHFTMDKYPFGGHHSAELGKTIREVLGASGKDATMPQDDPGAVKGDELKVVLDWADAFDKSHAAGEHQHHQGGHPH